MNASHLLAGVIGAAIGSGVTFIFCKKKFETLMDIETENFRNEIEKLEDEYKKIVGDELNDLSEEEKEYVENDVETLQEIAEKARQKEDYHQIASKYTKSPADEEPYEKDEKKEDWSSKVYYIDENTFGSEPDLYDAYCASYYADGVLADDLHDIPIEPEKIEHLNLNAEFEKADLVYVRDEDSSSDYEISFDDRTFDQMKKEKEE